MDRRMLLAVLASLAIYYSWMLMFPPPEPVEVADEPVAELRTDDTVAGASAGAVLASTAPGKEVEATLCGIDLVVNTADGGVRSIVVPGAEARYAIEPIYQAVLSGSLFAGEWMPYGGPAEQALLLSGAASGFAVGAGPLGATPPPPVQIVTQSASELTVRGTTPSGIEVQRTLTAQGEGASCTVMMDVTWRNTGASASSVPLWISALDVMPETTSRYDMTTRPWAFVDGEAVSREDLDDLAAPEREEGAGTWFGIMDAHFAVAALPEPGLTGSVWFAEAGGDPTAAPVYAEDTTAGPEPRHGVFFVLDRALAPGEAVTSGFSLYLGTKQKAAMTDFHPDLGEAVQLGWFSFFALPLMLALQFFQGIIGNWGWAIIALTLVIKGALFPLTQSSFKSMQAMQAIQPKLSAIREQFKDNPEEMNRQTMALFSESGVNPLGGCLPMFLQMPIWFALYTALLSSVELYHAEFFYLKDLSAADPYMVMPALCIGLMLLQQQFTPTSASMDPTQQRMMKMMPLVFGIFFFTFPSGLMLYIFMNMLLSVAQQWYIRRTFSTGDGSGGMAVDAT